jgi:hypothetical protein
MGCFGNLTVEIGEDWHGTLGTGDSVNLPEFQPWSEVLLGLFVINFLFHTL